MTWHYSRTTTFVAPTGVYYVGDLCYALSDELYHGVFGKKYYADGLYQEADSADFFLTAGTACGDGEYKDTVGRTYSVDAGIIGICPIHLATKGTEGGQIVTFDKAYICSFSEGVFDFRPADWAAGGWFTIDTGFDEDEDSE